MKKKLFSIFLAVCFLGCAFTPVWCQTKAQKAATVATVAVTGHHALIKHALARLIVKGPYTGLKGIAYSVLFTGESVVDGSRVVLTGADTVFDVLSLKGKLPVLDSIYAGIGIASKDAAWADTHVENWEMDIFGTHN